jgi:hypothetical protein
MRGPECPPAPYAVTGVKDTKKELIVIPAPRRVAIHFLVALLENRPNPGLQSLCSTPDSTVMNKKGS